MAALDFSPKSNTQRGPWLSDFRYENGRILVKSTGVWMKNDFQLWGDIRRWLTYYFFVRLVGYWVRLSGRAGPRIWFTPHAPRPWYIIWSAAVWGGVRFARSAETADAAFYFEDQTIAEPPAPQHARAFNFGCGDVSKSKVAEVMAQAFGYALALDPEEHQGEAVEKGEGNGLHDGRVVQCPCAPAPGKAYQRIIKTEDADGVAMDLRTATVGGKPVVVFVKKKPADARFSIQNTSVEVKLPHELFSAEEIAQLECFCAAMKLDWGGLDVLRETSSGRLYVVDVNKTDTGPAVVLNWRDRKRATSLLAKALKEMAAPNA
jgi:hypothetical protein